MSTEKIIKIVTVIPARNEEKHLRYTLRSLYNQSISNYIIVVNDGSIDTTANIAKVYADIIIQLPFHKESYIGTGKLAEVFNHGIEKAVSLADFTMISGADCIYPKDYIDRLLYEFELNPKLAIASGVIESEPNFTEHPRGAGRIIRNSFWKSVGGKYSVNYGFESYLLYKALDNGWDIRSFPDIQFISRTTKKNKQKMYAMGKAHRAMNIWWVNVLNMFRKGIFKEPAHTIYYIAGYLVGAEKYDTDLSVYNIRRFKECHPNLSRLLVRGK